MHSKNIIKKPTAHLLHELVKGDVSCGDLDADGHYAVQTLDLLTQRVDLLGGRLGLRVP